MKKKLISLVTIISMIACWTVGFIQGYDWDKKQEQSKPLKAPAIQGPVNYSEKDTLNYDRMEDLNLKFSWEER